MSSMLILVRVKPRAKRYKVERLPDSTVASFPRGSRKVSGMYRVFLKEPPSGGKANMALVRVLSDYFDKPVKILKGKSSRIKLVKVG